MTQATTARRLPFHRDNLGRLVREAWVRWAETQDMAKPSWLLPYDELDENEKEADRQIGEALARSVLAELYPSDYARAASLDNGAVDLLALAAQMKNKLFLSRYKGRGGWHDKAECSNADLSRMLREHVDKGDPVDVANFCAFLFARGERILQEHKPVRFQRRPPNDVNGVGWIEVEEDDIPHYRRAGNEIRALYLAPTDGAAQDRDALLSFLAWSPGPLGDRREAIHQYADVLISNLFDRNRLEHLLRILRPLKWTDLGVLAENPENRAQLEQLAEFMFDDALSRAANSAAENEPDRCPICAEALKAGDTCATDINEGTCHAECLDGAAVVDLATGEPSEGPISTFTYQPEGAAEEKGA